MGINVLWFSQHEMSPEQREFFGANANITQINGTAPNVHVEFQGEVNGVAGTIAPLKELVGNDFQIIAIVAPIGLQQQILAVAGGKPVIFAVNDRERQPGGEFKFIFKEWRRLVKIEVVTEPFVL